MAQSYEASEMAVAVWSGFVRQGFVEQLGILKEVEI